MEKCRLVQRIVHAAGHIGSFYRKPSSSSSSSSSRNGNNVTLFRLTTVSNWKWTPGTLWKEEGTCLFHFNLEFGKTLILSLYDFSPNPTGSSGSSLS